MKKISNSKKAFLAGVSSIFAICPSTSYAEFVPSYDAKQRMNSYWSETGSHLKGAIIQYEQKQKK